MRTDEMLKVEELAAENEQLRVDLADWQASSEAYRLDAEKLQADLGEWKQAAGIEAGLRREFLAENERLRAALKPFADVSRSRTTAARHKHLSRKLEGIDESRAVDAGRADVLAQGQRNPRIKLDEGIKGRLDKC